MIKGKFGQAKCKDCKSWHFAVNLDELGNITEFKCCRCGRLIPYASNIILKNEIKKED